MIKSFYSLSIILMLSTVLIFTTSCKKDDEGPDKILTVEPSALDFGDVQAGSKGQKTIEINTKNISSTVAVKVSGEGFSVDQTIVPGAGDINNVTVTFSPSVEAAVGKATGSIEIKSSGLSQIVELTANVTEIPIVEGEIPAGAIVYSNDFNFGLAHNAPFEVSDLEARHTLFEDVSVGYEIVLANPNNTGDQINVRVQATGARCEDNSASECGNAFQIVRQGSSLSFSLSGLTPGALYEVEYFVRPNGAAERSMNVIVSGDPEDPLETYIDFDNKIYVEKTRIATADADGKVTMKFEFAMDNNTRSISIDDLTVKAL